MLRAVAAAHRNPATPRLPEHPPFVRPAEGAVETSGRPSSRRVPPAAARSAGQGRPQAGTAAAHSHAQRPLAREHGEHGEDPTLARSEHRGSPLAPPVRYHNEVGNFPPALLGKVRPALTRHRQMSLQLPEPPGSAARQCHHSGQTLGKGLAWTVSIGAAEPAGCHSDRDRPSLPRQIMEHAPIDAVDAPGCHAASRTFGGGRTGRCLDGDMIRGRQHTGHLERPRDKRQQGRGQRIGTMNVSPSLSPIQPSSTSPISTQCAEEPSLPCRPTH